MMPFAGLGSRRFAMRQNGVILRLKRKVRLLTAARRPRQLIHDRHVQRPAVQQRQRLHLEVLLKALHMTEAELRALIPPSE